MARRAVRRRRAGAILARVGVDLALALLAAGVFLLGPPLFTGWNALEWTRHYATVETSTRPAERAQMAARWATRALDRLAPLPAASEAARLALEVGRGVEAERPAAALELYAGLRATLERLSASSWRGHGLAPLLAEARSREQAARARLEAASAAGARAPGEAGR